MRHSFNGEYPLTNPFGTYDPIAYVNYPGMKHPGNDWGLPANTPLVAGMSGTVSVFYRKGYAGRGNEVVITNAQFQRKTCHMNRIDVKDGQWINEGEPIGLSGNTGYVLPAPTPGNPNAGQHLHDELLLNGVYVDVRDYFKEDDMIDTDDKARDVFVAVFHEDAASITAEAIKSIKGQAYADVLPKLIGYPKWKSQNDRIVSTGGITPDQQAKLDAAEKLAQSLKALTK